MAVVSSSVMKKWLFLGEESALKKVKSAGIGPFAEIFAITEDDEVFFVEFDADGFDAREGPPKAPERVPILCQKKVKDFAFAVSYLIVLTECGKVYVFGEDLDFPDFFLMEGPLSGIKVTSVACGAAFNLAITSTGDVYAWGENSEGQIGDGTTDAVLLPKKIWNCQPSKPPGFFPVQVACGLSFSLLLLASGDVYSWGSNVWGQTGPKKRSIPTKVFALEGKKIKKVACGPNNSFALSVNGFLYSWGKILDEEEESDDLYIPKIVAEEIGGFADIVTSHLSYFTAAIGLSTKKIYIWGVCHFQLVIEPLMTPFKSLAEAYIFYTQSYPHIIEADEGSLDALRDAFNNCETSSVTFIVDGQKIHAHQDVLKIRSEHFRVMLNDKWQEDQNDVVINQFSYPVYKAYLNYLYCDEVELTNVQEVIELLDLANSYFDQKLKKLCVDLLINNIAVNNAAELFAVALKYEQKSLEDLTFEYFVAHMSEIVCTEAYANLNAEVCKIVLSKVGQSKMGTL